MNMKKFPGWAIALIAIVVGAAAIGGWHYYDVRGDLKYALSSEYGAVNLYTQLSQRAFGLKDALTLGVNYKEIRADEERHIEILSGYVGTDKEGNTGYPISREGAAQSEKDAIAMYKNIIKKVWFDQDLKEGLNNILNDELEHYEELQKIRAGVI